MRLGEPWQVSGQGKDMMVRGVQEGTSAGIWTGLGGENLELAGDQFVRCHWGHTAGRHELCGQA